MIKVVQKDLYSKVKKSEKWYVYRHVREDNNDVFYVGIGRRARMIETNRNNWWRKIYDKTNIFAEIVSSELTLEDALELEIFLISLYGRRDLNLGKLVNLTDGGDRGFKLSAETVEKIREKATGRVSKNKMSEELKKLLKEVNSIKVIDIENGVIYESISEAVRATGIKSIPYYLSRKRRNKTSMIYLKEFEEGDFSNIFKDVTKIGSFYSTKGGSICEIIQVNKNGKVIVKFDDEENTKKEVYMSHLKKGKVRNFYHPRVNKVGYIGEGNYKTSENQVPTKEYGAWKKLIKKAYDVNGNVISKPVCKDWLNFQNFAKWFTTNHKEDYEFTSEVFYNKSDEFDNKSCVFIPKNIKTFLMNFKKLNVRLRKKRYIGRIYFEKEIYVGSFSLKVEAEKACIIKKKEILENYLNAYRLKLPNNVVSYMENILII